MKGKLKNFPIDRCKAIGQKIYNIAIDVDKGSSLSKACRDNDVVYAQFLRLLQTNMFANGCNEERIIEYESQEEVILATITGSNDYVPVKNFMEVFREVLQELGERERKIIELRCFEGYTLKEVGEVYGITGNRVRDIEQRALRKLKKRSRFTRLTYGTLDDVDFRLENAKERLQNRVEETEKLKVQIEDKINRHDELIKALREEEDDLDNRIAALIEIKRDNEHKKAEKKELENIKYAGLSVRSYNCLVRAGIHTVSDLAEKSIKDLHQIRNLGVKSTDEILAVLRNRYNIVLRQE